MIKVKKCPFCGATPYLDITFTETRILCVICSTSMRAPERTNPNQNSIDLVVAKWNKRVPEKCDHVFEAVPVICSIPVNIQSQHIAQCVKCGLKGT